MYLMKLLLSHKNYYVLQCEDLFVDNDPKFITEHITQDKEHYPQLSIGDVIAVTDPTTNYESFFLCKSDGFERIAPIPETKILFADDLLIRDISRVIYVPTGEHAFCDFIYTDELEQMLLPDPIGIEHFRDDIFILHVEDSDLPNRVSDPDFKKIVYGDFFLANRQNEEIMSLSDDEVRKLLKIFGSPQRFLKVNGETLVQKIVFKY